jgi:hypothetical protein
MAEITIEIDEKGNIGKLPEPVQKFLDQRINEAFGKGAKKVEEELKPKLRSEADEERLKLLAEENSRFKEEEARRKGEHEQAQKINDERVAAALKDRDDKLTAKEQEIVRRDDRLRKMLGSEIKSAAVAAGARDESLPELMKLLGADLDLDPTSLEPFVKGADGKPATGKDGKAIAIEGYVQQYLADHPHHLKRTPGRSGNASGGATLRGVKGGGEVEETQAALAQNPNFHTLTAAVRASRTRAS